VETRDGVYFCAAPGRPSHFDSLRWDYAAQIRKPPVPSDGKTKAVGSEYFYILAIKEYKKIVKNGCETN
jgi:hypothetical protein